MFDSHSDAADEKGFVERGQDDRHHFRLIVSPEEATKMVDLKAFTRDLVADTERDLKTRLDWVAAEHWSTDNPQSICWSAARPTTAKTSSSAATISAMACALALKS